MTYPKGTTKEQWDQYEIELSAHNERVKREQPNMMDYGYTVITGFRCEADRIAFQRAQSDWEMMRSCDAPNKPGYYRANND